MKKRVNLAIFASGAGSNAKKMIEYFCEHPRISVVLVVSNKSNAGVLHVAQENDIEAIVLSRNDINQEASLMPVLAEKMVDLIVLAGFLLKVPDFLIHSFARRIINIHPSLLPKYGGKGMYGINVHRAVRAANEHETGITIHYVNEHYDEGEIILQKSCSIHLKDSTEDIAHKVLLLEHAYFAPEIEKICLNL